MKIPRYQSQGPAAPSVRYARMPTTLPGGGASGFGEALQDLGKGLARMAESDDRAYAAAVSAEAERHFSTRLPAAQDETGESADGFTPKMDQEVKDWIEQRLADAPSGRAKTMASERLSPIHSSVVSRAITFETTQRRTALGAKFDRAVDDLAVAAFNDPTSGVRHIQLAQEMPDDFDLLPGQRAEKRVAAPQKVAESIVKGIIATDPGAALKVLGAGTYDGFMDGDKKAQLTTAARVRMEALADGARADADRRERQAANEIKKQGDVAAKELNDLFDAKKLTKADIDRRRGVLSPSEHLAFIKMLDPDGSDIKDDRDTLGRLVPILDTPGAGAEIDRAFAASKLSSGTYLGLRDKHRLLRDDDTPDSPYKAARRFVATALDDGQLGGDPIAQQPLKIAKARALTDLDVWARENGGAGHEAFQAQADGIVERYQAVAFGELRLALPRPFGFTGRKQDVDDAVIDAAVTRIEAGRKAGTLSEAEGDRQITVLRAWERAIQPKPKAEKK